MMVRGLSRKFAAFRAELGPKVGRSSPRETWTQAQRDAADRLAEILLPRAYLGRCTSSRQAELERQGKSNVSDAVLERGPAIRGVALIDAEEWKQRDTRED